ncbi:hypothetical protein TMatcc_000160 [Talaromyces marneffei ATCC 18224]
MSKVIGRWIRVSNYDALPIRDTWRLTWPRRADVTEAVLIRIMAFLKHSPFFCATVCLMGQLRTRRRQLAIWPATTSSMVIS